MIPSLPKFNLELTLTLILIKSPAEPKWQQGWNKRMLCVSSTFLLLLFVCLFMCFRFLGWGHFVSSLSIYENYGLNFQRKTIRSIHVEFSLEHKL
jgi:hypothetical protein